MLRSFDQFVQERLYLKNVTEKTIRWYGESWRAFTKCLPSTVDPLNLTDEDIREAVIGMRRAGVSPIRVNTYLRAINA